MDTLELYARRWVAEDKISRHASHIAHYVGDEELLEISRSIETAAAEDDLDQLEDLALAFFERIFA